MSTWRVEGHFVVDEARRTVCTPSTSTIAEQIVKNHNMFPDLVSYLIDSGKPQLKGEMEFRRKQLMKTLRLEG